jgi:hypothetical protein
MLMKVITNRDFSHLILTPHLSFRIKKLTFTFLSDYTFKFIFIGFTVDLYVNL